MFIEHLVWIKHCPKHFSYMNSFNLHNKSCEVGIMIIPILQLKKGEAPRGWEASRSHIAKKVGPGKNPGPRGHSLQGPSSLRTCLFPLDLWDIHPQDIKIVSQDFWVVLMVKNPVASAGNKRRRFHPWVGKIPWRRAWQLTPVFPGESHGQRSLVGYSL